MFPLPDQDTLGGDRKRPVCHTPGRNNENPVDRIRNHALFQQVRLVEMKHIFPRRRIGFLEQVPHRPVPASFEVALSNCTGEETNSLAPTFARGISGKSAAAVGSMLVTVPCVPKLPVRRASEGTV